MCLGIPAKIIAIEGKNAKVEIGGVIYVASIMLLENAGIGDFIILHAGFAIEKVDPIEAEETIRLFNEIESES
jgi:hydrogenase expression/formation protein HypC